MPDDYGVMSAFMAIASLVIGIIAIISAEYRFFSIIMFLSALIVVGLLFKVQQLNAELKKTNESYKRTRKTVQDVRQELEIHKKIYNLENAIKSMQKQIGRKGGVDPLWLVVAVFVIVAIVLVLLTTGIL